MPARRGSGNGAVYLPGVWAHLREKHQIEVDRGDPRLDPAFTPDWTDEQRERAQNAPGSHRVTMRRVLDRMDAGEPLSWPTWGVRHWPGTESVAWLNDPYHGPRDVLVFPDDRVEPIYSSPD